MNAQREYADPRVGLQQGQPPQQRQQQQQDYGATQLYGGPARPEGDRPQGGAQVNRQPKNKGVYENFHKTIVEFNRIRNTPMREAPVIEGRPVILYTLYGYVLKAGGSDVVETRHLWPSISESLGFQGHDEELAEIHRRYLHEFEREWLAKRKGHTRNPSVDQTQQAPNATPQHSRNHSMQAANQDGTTDESRATSVKPATPTATVPQARPRQKEVLYKPLKRKFDTYAGLDVEAVTTTAKELARLRPYPTFQELGRLDIQALSKSVQSGLPAEVGNALDILVITAGDKRWGLPLLHCADLLDALVECMSENVAVFDPEKTTPLLTYENLVGAARRASSRLQPCEVIVGSFNFEEHAAIERVMSVLTILRNLAFTEINQEVIAKAPGFAAVVASSINAFCARERLPVIPAIKALDFMKDMVTLLSLVSAHLVVESQDVANALVSFVLCFAPSLASGSLGCLTYNSLETPYLAPAVDACAKLLSRDIPNRSLFEAVLVSSPSLQSHALTGLMALATTLIPSTLGTNFFQALPRRVPLLHHALIVAEAAADMCPANSETVRGWTEDRILTLRLANLHRLLMSSVSAAREAQDGPAHGGGGGGGGGGGPTPVVDPDVDTFCRRLANILRSLEAKAPPSVGGGVGTGRRVRPLAGPDGALDG